MSIPKFASKEKLFLRGVGIKYLDHPAFNKWFQYFITEYKPPSDKNILLFLPCSWGKPYSQSYIHYEIIKTLKKLPFYEKIHQVILSNTGVIPREYEHYWPFTAYDWEPEKETKQILSLYLKFAKYRLLKFIKKSRHHYKSIFCYFRRKEEEEMALKFACAKLGCKFFSLLSEKVFNKYSQKPYDDLDQILIEKECLRDLYKNFLNAK